MARLWPGPPRFALRMSKARRPRSALLDTKAIVGHPGEPGDDDQWGGKTKRPRPMPRTLRRSRVACTGRSPMATGLAPAVRPRALVRRGDSGPLRHCRGGALSQGDLVARQDAAIQG